MTLAMAPWQILSTVTLTFMLMTFVRADFNQSDLENLEDDLFAKYRPGVMPIVPGEATVVHISITLLSILEVSLQFWVIIMSLS